MLVEAFIEALLADEASVDEILEAWNTGELESYKAQSEWEK